MSYGWGEWDLGNGVDCDGVLSLWFCGSVFEEWESIKGGRVERCGELLFAGVVVPSQSECDAPRGLWMSE